MRGRLILAALALAVAWAAPAVADDPSILNTPLVTCTDGVCTLAGGGGGATPSGSNNEILTDDGASGITSEPNATMDGSTFSLNLDGTLGTPPFQIGADGDAALYVPAANELGISVGATLAEVVNVGNDGTDHTVTVKGSATQAGNLFVVEDSGGADHVSISSAGHLDLGTNVFLRSDNTVLGARNRGGPIIRATSEFGWVDSAVPLSGTVDATLNRAGARKIAIGDAAGATDATPSAGTLIGQSASGTDIAGANLNIAGGQGAGTGAGGSVVLQTAPAGGTGSSLNSLTDGLTVSDTAVTAGSGRIRVDTAQSVTCADSGDANPGALTIAPTSSYVEITNSDSDGCDITMSETGAVQGAKVDIIVVSNAGGNVTFADTSGVSELSATFNATVWQSLSLRYAGDRFVEMSRSSN